MNRAAEPSLNDIHERQLAAADPKRRGRGGRTRQAPYGLMLYGPMLYGPMLALASVLLFALLAPSLDASELRRTAIVKAVERARDSVVNIRGQKIVTARPGENSHSSSPRRVNGMGTGVVIDGRGYIVTNHHVVADVTRIYVTLADRTRYIARLISHDPKTDLAIIKIDVGDKRLPVITLGTSSDLMPGETVIAVGNAYGYEHTVTCGIISALGRTVQISDAQSYHDLIQTDASINPGNSGGPLLNIHGEMIGVNVAVRVGAQGIGFALPVDKVMDVSTDLLSIRRLDRTWHGVVARRSAKGDLGLVIKEIEPGSPADEADLKPGDVITRVGKMRIYRQIDLERALLGKGVGKGIEFSLQRKNKSLSKSLILTSLPKQPNSLARRTWDLLGLRLKSVPAARFRQRHSRYRGGLAVTEVRPDGPAFEQGIRPGDVLVGMHIWETISLENVAYVFGRDDLADIAPIKFYILRGSQTLYGYFSLDNE